MIPAKEYQKIIESVPIVCVDAVIINDNNEYLLVKRQNEPLKGEYWVPGGRVLKNESLRDAIKRKMKQELGIELNVEKLLGYFEDFYEKTHFEVSNGLHVISFVFLVKSKDQKKFILDYQSNEWIWSKDLPIKLVNKLQLFGESVS